MRHTFPKAEHLCLQRDIEALFSPGRYSHSAFPLRIVVRPMPYDGSGARVKVLLSVSKRKLRHAVDRNRVKRQIREGYRLQKNDFIALLPADVALHIAFIWLSDKPENSTFIHKRLLLLLQRTADRFANSSTPPTS